MHYLKINPETGEAIGGVFTKEDHVTASDYVDFRPTAGSAGVGWIWEESSGTWSEPVPVDVIIDFDHEAALLAEVEYLKHL